MSVLEYLAVGLELWTLIGLAGLTVSLVRRERHKLWQGVGSLIGVWVIYLTVLAVVSYRQPAQQVAMGQSTCFHSLCFRVAKVEDIQEFPLRSDTQLMRVVVQVTNHSRKKEAREQVRAYLVDAQGRQWEPSNAVSGNPLSDRVLAGGTMMSEPLFRVAKDANGLRMMLTHGRWTWRRLVIGDPESLWHRPRILLLER